MGSKPTKSKNEQLEKENLERAIEEENARKREEERKITLEAHRLKALEMERKRQMDMKIMLKREVRDKEMEGYFFVLPIELIMRIFLFLNYKQIVNIGLVSWRWKIYSEDENLWKNLLIRHEIQELPGISCKESFIKAFAKKSKKK